MKKCDYCGGDDLRQCYDSDISDEAFAVIEPILQNRPKIKAGRPVEYPWREIINTIFYLLRTGCQWRQLPHDLVKWWVACRWFRTLGRDLAADPRRAPRPGTPRRGPRGRADRVRDGLPARRVRRGRREDRLRQVQALPRPQAPPRRGHAGLSLRPDCHRRLRQRPGRGPPGASPRPRGATRPWPCAVVDGGYANAVDDSIITWARENTPVTVQVVKRTDDLKGFRILPRRWVIERTSAWLSAHRRLARDFERLAETAEAMIDLAMIDVMGNRLAGGTRWEHWRTMTTRPPAGAPPRQETTACKQLLT